MLGQQPAAAATTLLARSAIRTIIAILYNIALIAIVIAFQSIIAILVANSKLIAIFIAFRPIIAIVIAFQPYYCNSYCVSTLLLQ